MRLFQHQAERAARLVRKLEKLKADMDAGIPPAPGGRRPAGSAAEAATALLHDRAKQER